jgi:LemA protein
MRAGSFFLILIGLLVAAVVWAIGMYNALVRRRNQVEDAWSGIEVQLKRRHNLIPNILETVKGYAKHEKDVLSSVTKLRSASQAAGSSVGTPQQEQAISQALRSLMVQVEAYPELKADANFRQLQEQLQEVEEAIQNARRYYNATVRDYNTTIQSFPSNLIADRFGFKEAEFFELDDNDVAREVPKVKF